MVSNDSCVGSGFSHRHGSDEPIAIVGMGCRLPGGATSPSKLWELLINGRSGHCEIPSSRFDAESFYHPDTDHLVGVNSTGGYFIEDDIRLFDNTFFGINNMETTYMDAQQRQLLEVCFECFENAGLTLDGLSGANVGCYVANFLIDFVLLQTKDPELFHRYSATGMGATILANRISNAFNLKGPSVVMDTACSSSLYALHAACSALRLGECESAVVAGVNLIQTPEVHLAMVKGGFLSPTSTCHTFDVSADGYGRGEGVAALYIKRLSDAIRDGDPIRSVIRSTAVNSNGHTNGIALPSVSGQEAVIRKAYAMAGLPTTETGYIEAHGTGTPVGDPIEVEALARVFDRKPETPILIGSVKPNLGHSEAVSGLTSIIKVTLALEKGMIPPTIGVNNINPALKLVERNVQIVTSPIAWPETVIRRASVNSFGYGGANGHAILESAPASFSGRVNGITKHRRMGNFTLLPFSGQEKLNLLGQVARISSVQFDKTSIPDLAFTLTSHRSNLSSRGYLLVEDANIDRDLQPDNLQVFFSDSRTTKLPIAFIFTGQGAQWPLMGHELFTTFPVYRRTIQTLDAFLQELPESPSWTIEESILEPSETSKLGTAIRSQTICTAVQIAIVELLRDWNITPEVVVGHSSGEIAAAFAAGHLTAAKAIAIAYYRGLAVSQISKEGAMAAVGLDGPDCKQEITTLGLDDQVRVACFNSPQSSTISGDAPAIDQLVAALQKKDVFARKLRTDQKAYHSNHMRAASRRYMDLLNSLYCKSVLGTERGTSKPRAKMLSSVINKSTERELIDTPEYWTLNLEKPVVFNYVMRNVLNSPHHIIEIGPHSALQQPIKQINESINNGKGMYVYSPTILRGKNSLHTLLQLCGALFLHQQPVDINRANRVCSARDSVEDWVTRCHLLQDLPTYKWNHDTLLWNESRLSRAFRGPKPKRHALLGSQIQGTSDQCVQWRNVLRVKDVPWLTDHKLGSTTVFPGAGYLAMAAEALSQVHKDPEHEFLGVSFRQVHIRNMLVLPDSSDVEVFTELRAKQLSSITTSARWWSFEIASLVDNVSTVHANGQIAVQSDQLTSDSRFSDFSVDLMEEQAVRTWYNALSNKGLRFGPTFQSLSKIHNDGAKMLHRTIAETDLLRGGPGNGQEQKSAYLIHPITLDALLQTAIISSAAGSASRLRGKVPVKIDEVEIMIPSSPDFSSPCTIYADSTKVGFGVATFNAELKSPNGRVLVHLGNIRGVPYEDDNIGTDQLFKDRNPVLRVLWKPDLSILTGRDNFHLTNYTDRFAHSLRDHPLCPNSSIGRLAGAVDLLTHWNPRLRILEVGDGDLSYSTLQLDLLHADNSLKQFSSYGSATVAENGSLGGLKTHEQILNGDSETQGSEIGNDDLFDALIFHSKRGHCVSDVLTKKVLRHLAPDGAVIFLADHNDGILPDLPGFSIVSTIPKKGQPLLTIARVAEKIPQVKRQSFQDVILVERNSQHEFNALLQTRLCEYFGCQVNRVNLENVSTSNIPTESIIISTVELEQPILETPSPNEMKKITCLTDNASTVVWITGGGMFTANNPSFALTSGFARTLNLEQPSLKMFLVDFDVKTEDFSTCVSNSVAVLHQGLHRPSPEFEYLQHNGCLYSSRFVPDESMNKRFRRGQNSEAETMSLSEAGHCRLNTKRPGQIGSLYFDQFLPIEKEIKPGYVEVKVQAVGLNAKDIYTLFQKVDTKQSTCSLEFSGIITRTSSTKSEFRPGDRVVVMAPSHFATYECVPEWACCRLNDDEDFETCSTIPLVFSTALYALQHRAQLQPEESILIHSAAGGLGIAAIQVAQSIGAEIFATVGTLEKREFLIQNFGLQEDHIFSSRDSTFHSEVLRMTSGRGVDVVLNSLTGDLLHDSWRTCAEFGRFVEVGKSDIVNGGNLDMAVFKRGATFTAFDLSDLFWSRNKRQNNKWAGLLKQSMQLYREGSIKPVDPLRVFDASEVVSAFQHFTQRSRVGKVAVSFSEPRSQIPVATLQFKTRLNPDKAYMLIGCLGGLGRSLSKWMFDRGARKFAFLSRSGADQGPAKRLVDDLRRRGAKVDIFRGSVSDASDVQTTVAKMQDPIGGVVHAAMGLDLALITEMTSKVWLGGIEQKVQGAWNIHNALAGRDDALDFFLMTSSISGSIGVATESNYCAANAFLDAFARYRRKQGLPAVALGLGMISEVGYLHEHPEIEALMLRKGIHPITEDELLQLIDIALCPDAVDTSPRYSAEFPADHFSEGHILTGLEALGLEKILSMGWDRPTAVLDDPRTGIIAGGYATLVNAKQGDDSQNGHDNHGESNDSGLPSSVSAALNAQLSVVTDSNSKGLHDKEHPPQPSEALVQAVQTVVAIKIGALLLVPTEQLTVEKQLADFGMDSMLAAEFRGSMFRVFRVDVSFATLLDRRTSVGSLAFLIATNLLKKASP